MTITPRVVHEHEITPRQSELLEAQTELFLEHTPDFCEMIALGVWIIGNAVANAPPSERKQLAIDAYQGINQFVKAVVLARQEQ